MGDELKLLDRKRLVLYYCCGLDHARKCGLLQGRLKFYDVGTLVVRRPTKELQHIKLKSDAKKALVVVDAPPVDFDRSSTIVRDLMKAKKWKELEKYLHPSVIEYLREDPKQIITKIIL